MRRQQIRKVTLLMVSLICHVFLASAFAQNASDQQLRNRIASSGKDTAAFSRLSELKSDNYQAYRTSDALYLAIAKFPDDRKLEIPRLNNPIQRVYLLGQSAGEWKLIPEPSRWLIEVPSDASVSSSPVVVVETIGAPHIPRGRHPNTPDEDGSIVLPAHHATTHGKMLRYEPQPHKNTVGYWTQSADWAAWNFKIERPGRYTVHILQGCGEGQGGSEVGVHVRAASTRLDENQPPSAPTIRFTVQDTGHFQNFVPRRLGEIELRAPGQYTLELRPSRLANKAVMDVREVRLVPNDN